MRHGNRPVRATAVFLVWMFPGISLVAPACSVAVPKNAPADIQALIAQLATDKEWGAASRLQTLGAPAAAALVAHLRQDGFRDRDHGNHSPTMRALEKIGDPAIDEIERGLTPAVLRSTKPEDIQYIETVLRVLTSIGGSAAAPVLIRAAISAQDWQSRELAFNGVVWPAFEFIPMRPGRPWEVCLHTESRYACPFDSEGPRVAAVVKPLLGVVRDHMARESHAQVRVAAAQLLALWGVGELRSAGEKELLTLAARLDDTNTSRQTYRYWVADALVQLGDSQGIPALIDELDGLEESARSLASVDLQRYTQQDIPYDAKAPAAARKTAADEWRRWWRSTRTTFTVKTRAARIDIDCCRM